MAIEIERKFLVTDDRWKEGVAKRRHLRQAYLSKNERVSVRIRIDGTHAATLTIKTVTPGIERQEFEYAVPVADAEELLAQCEGAVITKLRHLVPVGALTFEIDVFEGENAGLVIAEIELQRADQAFEQPAWLGAEVTHERRYYNADLARHPFSRW
jgi:adenylate cyclase